MPMSRTVSSESWSKLTRAQREGFAPLAPDFVIELLSPNDSKIKTRAKLETYMSNGTRLGWLIDPFAKVVEIFRPGRKPQVRENPPSIDGEAPVDGFSLTLERIFSEE